MSSLHVKHFRHLRDISIGPFAEPTQQSDVLAFAGPNGGGKSSLLELVSFALANPWGHQWAASRTFGEYSFEIAFRITDEELQLIKQSGNAHISDRVLEALEAGREIFVGHNFPDGEYSKEMDFYNEVFSVVTSILRHQAQRNMGFFLRADRNYPNRGFARENIFNFKQLRQKTHLWSFAFNLPDAQYADMYDYLVQQRWHHMRDLGAYYYKEERIGDPPADPLIPYDELLQRLFPGYKFGDLEEEIPTNLYVELPTGDVVPFNDLSGGEKEVFFVLSFFLRRNVSNAIILVDEPELHLHPELARKLVQQMKRIRPGNQVWLATHNPEVIDEAGRDRTFYVSRKESADGSLIGGVQLGTNEGEAEKNLRSLFGYSGYIGVARRLVFLEGQDSSADRKLLTALFPEAGSEIKFIPAGGVDTLYRINSATLSILEAEFGVVRYYLIRDHDYLDDNFITAYHSRAAGRIRVLKRYHIENYLLDDEAISHVLADTYNKTITPAQVRQSLNACARAMSGEVATQMTAFRLNLALQPQDFSQGKFMSGTSLVDSAGLMDPSVLATISGRFDTTAQTVRNHVSSTLEPVNVSQIVTDCASSVAGAVNDDSWRSLFPGRALLEAFCKREAIGEPIVLQNCVIKALGSGIGRIDAELGDIVRTIQSDGEL
ncbi:AAA family ATPase [Pseudonocardia endophytica]|uniref:AAA family ATPase n=1 Tax=Pseudonocardia endophytica TaxID=401976 RepID=UPI0014054BBA|nr:ATP-binding protein [Pseudonocardia endophytica]